jgi:O-antigen/teichoic acid export membrane protein
VTYFLLVTVFVTVSLSVFAREAVLVLATPAYESAASLVPWLCWGSIAWGVARIVGIGGGIVKKSYHTTVATALAALVNIGLNLLLIPIWGVTGAVAATMLGYVVALAYQYAVGQRYFPVDYESHRVGTLAALAIAAVGAGVLIDSAVDSWSPGILLYKMPLYAGFVASLFVFRVIGSEEVDKARGYLLRRLSRLTAGR